MVDEEDDFPPGWTDDMKVAGLALLAALRGMPEDKAKYTLALEKQKAERDRRAAMANLPTPEASQGGK